MYTRASSTCTHQPLEMETPVMKLKNQNRLTEMLTQKELEKLHRNFEENYTLSIFSGDVKAFEPVVKFFNPTGLGTWYLSELSPDNIGFGICVLNEIELGYVSLHELNTLKLQNPIEKDNHFLAEGLTIYELMKILNTHENVPGIIQNRSIYRREKKSIEHITKVLVKDHILMNQTLLVCTCLEKGMIEYDAISNTFGYFDQQGNQLLDENLEEAQEGDGFDDLYHEEHKEIYSWYLITDWLARKLSKKGESILDNEYGTWWGRSCFGQLIVCDSVIQEIAKEHY